MPIIIFTFYFKVIFLPYSSSRLHLKTNNKKNDIMADFPLKVAVWHFHKVFDFTAVISQMRSIL